MESVWAQAAQTTQDGGRCLFFKTDQELYFLYSHGFVDYQKYPLKQWIAAFQTSRQKGGSYRITHDQWLEKSKFCYMGAIGVPFDAMTLPDKTYTEKELKDFLSERIIPQTVTDDKAIPELIEQLKTKKKIVNGSAKLDADLKQIMNGFMNTYASPMRQLELENEAIRLAQQRAQTNTAFSAGMTAQQAIMEKMKNLSGQTPETQAASDAPSLSLKDLKKKRPSGRV